MVSMRDYLDQVDPSEYLWRIILIMLTEMRISAHSGWYHSLALGYGLYRSGKSKLFWNNILYTVKFCHSDWFNKKMNS